MNEPEPTDPKAPPPLSDDDPRLDWALFRYGVIADLVTHVLAPGELSQAIREAAGRRYLLPSGGEAVFSARTLWSWLKQYRRGGIEALLPKRREDLGELRAMSKEALERAAAFRREDRTRSASQIADMLERKGRIKKGSVSRQTIDRALRRLGLERLARGKVPGKVRRRIEVSGPNALWVGDYHDPVAIPLHSGGALRCHLGAFIDHFSRYLVYGAYYPSQAIYTLEDVFKKAVLKAGRPAIAYVDNAKIYHSHAFAFACDRIGTKLTHSKAYESEGRGVIERFWGTVAPFERELARRGARDLAEVNQLFWAWLEERYHALRHDEIGVAPNERRAGFVPVFPKLDLLSELFLVKVRRTVNKKLSRVEVEGAAFHVDPSLRGKLVQVHYDPHDLSSVVIYFDGRRIERASRALPNTAPESPPAPEALPTGFDYLGQILIDHERRRAASARAIAFAAIKPEAHFDLARFERALEVAMGRPLNPRDRAQAREGGLFRSRTFEEGARRLQHLVAIDGIGLLTGETGSGKSTLLRELDRSADAGRTRICYVSFTSLRSFGFLVQLGGLFGLAPRRFKGEMARAVLEALASGGRKTVLIVDEAHRLPDDTLEDLRLLTTSDFDAKSAFTLILSGQPLLKDRLDEPNNQALLQRVTLRHVLAPLSEPETSSYIEQRLRAAGGDPKIFDRSAIEAIFNASRGVPRLINTLANHGMLAALARGKRHVAADCIQDALVEIEHP
jgi:type II secretory pathway predicted ATPase ExeA/transposase InsO family protein